MTTFIQIVENDFKIAWGLIDGEIEKDAILLWNDAKALVTTLAPAEYQIFKALVVEALTDVATGDYADLETAVLNKAEAAGAAFVADIEKGVLKALIALIASL